MSTEGNGSSARDVAANALGLVVTNQVNLLRLAASR